MRGPFFLSCLSASYISGNFTEEGLKLHSLAMADASGFQKRTSPGANVIHDAPTARQ